MAQEDELTAELPEVSEEKATIAGYFVEAV